MGCGFYSIVASGNGQFVQASWAIVLAGIFDALDGRIARLAKATSEFGVEYDSMSDLVSFGMAPAMLLFQWSLVSFDRLGWLAAFLYMVCAALRLARFNVVPQKLKGYFQGLPSPASAAIVTTTIIFDDHMGVFPGEWIQGLGLIMALGLGALMVSNIPFPTFKELHWRSRATPGILLIGVGTLVAIAVRPEVTLFVLALAYPLLSGAWLAYLASKKKKPGMGSAISGAAK